MRTDGRIGTAGTGVNACYARRYGRRPGQNAGCNRRVPAPAHDWLIIGLSFKRIVNAEDADRVSQRIRGERYDDAINPRFIRDHDRAYSKDDDRSERGSETGSDGRQRV